MCKSLSHIAFADDLILVAEASLEQVQCIKDIMEEFCNASGQKINFNKSQVFFSNNVNEVVANEISSALGIRVTCDLGHYLGVPMLHQRASKEVYNYILDRLRQKLSCWKSNSLSFAGRVTLTQSCLLSIPGYVIQSTLLPASICCEVERICRNFIWGSADASRKCHLISWEKICQPKEEGGLGFRDLRMLNRAYMMKLNWSMLTQLDKLWVRVMKAKYACGPHGIPSFHTRSISSHTWRAIVSAWEDVWPHMTWVIRNGHNVRFWLDAWVPSIGALGDVLHGQIPSIELNLPVHSYTVNGNWNWSLITRIVPPGICDRIAVLNPPVSSFEDFPCWNLSPTGAFTLSSAYTAIRSPATATPDPIFNLVWKWQGPQRIRATLWKLAHTKLMTNAERRYRGMTADDLCPRCNCQPKTILHCLRDYEDVQEFWTTVIQPDLWSRFFSLGVHAWLHWNLTDTAIGLHTNNWQPVFGVTIDALWRDRNTLVFSAETSLGQPLMQQILNQVMFIRRVASMRSAVFDKPATRTLHIAWQRPPVGCYKINVDGSFYSNGNSSACGGLIRDSNGTFLRGFYCRVGACNVVWTELWALKQGIQQARLLGLHWVIFELDSKLVVDMVNSNSTNIVFLQPLLEEITSTLRRTDWRASVVYIFREANRCADFLANKGHSSSYEGFAFDSACNMLSLYLLNDASGGSTPRRFA